MGKRPQTTDRSDALFALVLTVLFAVLAGIVLNYHEMWRDELEPWMIARYSTSLSDLSHNMAYEGHPVLWYLVLYAVTRAAYFPEAMGYVHLLLAAASVYLLARFAPLPRAWKALYAFGFYPFYQYAIVSRGYALCILLTFAFCAIFPQRARRTLALAAILALLANGDVYGWFFSLALSVALAAAWLADRRGGAPWPIGWARGAAAAALVIAGICYSVASTMPPADTGHFPVWHTSFSTERLVHAIYGLTFKYNFLVPGFYLPFNIAVFAVLVLWFARRRVIVVTWLTLCALLFAFYYTKFTPEYWHSGMVLIFAVACLWLASGFKDEPLRWRWTEKLSLISSRLAGPLVTAVLAFFVVYGLKWVADDIRRPYSAAWEAARFIKANSLQEGVLVGDSDFTASSVSAYLDTPIYYPAGQCYGRYVVWNNKRYWPISMRRLADSVARLSGPNRKDVLLILNYELPSAARRQMRARLVHSFTGTVKADESYWLYKVAASQAPKCPAS